MEQGIKRTQRDYSLAFKLSVVAQVEKGELTYKEAQRRYGIQGRSTVLVWLRKHGLQDWADPSGRARSGSTMSKQDAKPLTPEQRIRELETQLREAQEKAALFEAVLDVMRKDYGITVKKPSGVVAQKRIKKLSVERACRYMGISRQAYYKRCRSEERRSTQAEVVTTLVRDIRLRQPRLGARKLHHLLGPVLGERGIKLGRDRLFDVLRAARLLVVPHRAYHKTTQSHHRFRRHPNLLKPGPDQVVPTGPEQVWVADITYLPTAGAFVYLSLITDAFSRKIVGHHVHDSLQTEQVSQALKKALRTRQTSQPLIHHSDRGIQYCSTYYQDIHRRHGLRCSMTDGYDCYQNALAERVNGILKGEFLLQRPADLEQATKMVEQSVRTYNHERPHAALKYKTPDAVHRAF
ncbi:IS3 family transposase [Burkholderia multivorans]|uniref:IS3 family transposase n=2 Tax=Burkholderia multivorans TaxID=87883 RepID=UPI001C231B47|nr:IS3 family transposase [Burkholderia multivorans]MBU9212434.1 IS3 family transposase [Burkholderia multivorans]MCO1460099.1 IS3 family transposase [Burkholderia multivorans]MCO1460173.1 IS3 family transposase [Burkholderia multivorans]MCO1462562.1 IS3 family transposase [Burkholderia multivorans]UQN67922.1 IS3 family transposase [Burkholderia multivorans]